MDKDYLVRDAQTLKEKIDKQLQQNETLERAVENAKHKKRRLKEELEQLRHRQLSGHEDRIEKGMNCLSCKCMIRRLIFVCMFVHTQA